MLQYSNPFRVAPVKVRLASEDAVCVEHPLVSIGVEAPVAIQIEVETELGSAGREVRHHEDRRPRVVKQVRLIAPDIIVAIERQPAAGIDITDIRQAGQIGPETRRSDKIGRDKEIIGEPIALRRDARDDFGEGAGLAGLSRQFGVRQTGCDCHRGPLAAADAEEQDRHERHHRQHDQRDDQGDTALGIAFHCAVRMGMRS